MLDLHIQIELFNFLSDNLFKMAAILVGFQIVGTKAIGQPFANRTPKCLVFECFRYLNIRCLDPHCNIEFQILFGVFFRQDKSGDVG